MYLGSYKTEFNGKNRLVLPRRFRRELGQDERFYVLLGENGEIMGFDEKNWQKLAESVLKMPLSEDQGKSERLRFFSRADECGLDNQGRFVLPQEFMDKVSLGSQVLMVGAGDHFEIWDIESWERLKW